MGNHFLKEADFSFVKVLLLPISILLWDQLEVMHGGYAKVIGQSTKYRIVGMVGIDKEHDLLLLSIPSIKAPSLVLGDSDKITVGDEVYVIGNPYGLEGTFSQGIVSSIRTLHSDTLLQITAPISPGSSGEPVLNTQGEIIGVSMGTIEGGQNLNFAIPSSYLSR